MRTTGPEHPTPNASGTGDRAAAEKTAWRRRFQIGLVLVTAGAVIWQLSVSNPLLFPDIPDANLGDTQAERAAVISDHFTQWRVAWFFAMFARVLIGVGLFIAGGALAMRDDGRRRQAARAVAWFAALNIPLGIARFAITLGDADFAAEPGLWFGILWGLHFLGTMIAVILLLWLTWANPAPRWSAIALALTLVAGLVIVAPALMYSPGFLLYGAATLWRARRPTRSVGGMVVDPAS